MRLVNRLIEIAKQPESRQDAQFTRLLGSVRSVDTILIHQFFWIESFGRAIRPSQAIERCGVVMLAVERFRLRHGHWPMTLDELPTDLLVRVPTDPLDGKPLRYVRRAGEVVIYSIGMNRRDDGGDVTEPKSLDLGVRLRDVSKRSAQKGSKMEGAPSQLRPSSVNSFR